MRKVLTSKGPILTREFLEQHADDVGVPPRKLANYILQTWLREGTAEWDAEDKVYRSTWGIGTCRGG